MGLAQDMQPGQRVRLLMIKTVYALEPVPSTSVIEMQTVPILELVSRMTQ